MKKLYVDLDEHSYDIIIGNNITSNFNDYISKIYSGEKLFVITDSNVFNIYRDEIKTFLSKYDISIYIIPAGEKNKRLDEISKIYEKMIEENITRNDLVVAFGGGVVGDMAGFAASTFMRGVPFIQIPTTIVSQVDSSVGGKVGVDLPQGKNLVGSFYQPKLVLIDIKFLDTLTNRYFYDGFAEIVKYACIYDKKLFEKLEEICESDNLRETLMNNIEDIVYISCDIKRVVVQEDEKEKNLRMILNFGHSIGHAIEQYYNYEKYTHGEAVSIGMVDMLKIGESKDITEKQTEKRVSKLLSKLNLPIKDDNNNLEISNIIKRDKKNKNGIMNFIFISEIGKYKIIEVKQNEIYDFLYK